VSKIESTIVADEVYRRIKFQIIEGTLTPGTRIDRRALAADLGVSMTPVNEAAARLVGERFLERRTGPNRESDGLFVPERPIEELIHVFAVRAGIEGIAARLCVEKALAGGDSAALDAICASFSAYEGISEHLSPEQIQAYLIEDRNFHEAIIEYSGNPILADIDRNLGCIHRSYIKGLIRPPKETYPEHKEIIAAFRDRDAAKVQDLLSRHNLKSRDVIKERVRLAENR